MAKAHAETISISRRYKAAAQTLCGGFFAAKTDTCSQKVQPFEQKILFFSCKIDNTD
jgi:hypothetical protein